MDFEHRSHLEEQAALTRGIQDHFSKLPQIMCLIGPDDAGKKQFLNMVVQDAVNKGGLGLVNLTEMIDALKEKGDADQHSSGGELWRRFAPCLLAGSRSGGFCWPGPDSEIWFEDIPKYVEDLRAGLGPHKKLLCISYNSDFINALRPEEVAYIVKQPFRNLPAAGAVVAKVHLAEHPQHLELMTEGYSNSEMIRKIGRQSFFDLCTKRGDWNEDPTVPKNEE